MSITLSAAHSCLLGLGGKQLDRQLSTGSQVVANSWLPEGQGLGKKMIGKLVATSLGKRYVDGLQCKEGK